MSDWTDESVVVEGHRLHAVTAGDPDAPVVVLLHGGIIDAAHVTWGEVIDPLAREYRVVALDLLGYGESDKPNAEYSIATHVGMVEGFLETLGRESVHLVGASMGGAVALGLALRSPGLVDRLVLQDSYGLGRELPNGLLSYLLARVQVVNKVSVALLRLSRGLTKASLGSIARDPDELSPAAVDAVWAEAKRPGAGKAFRGFRAAEVTRRGYRTDFTDRLDGLAAPTLLVHGRHDEVFPVAWSERAAARIPDAEIAIFEDCAHWAPRERPERFVERVESFLSA